MARLILNFLCLLALIIHESGLGEIENQPWLKNLNLNLILTCNRDTNHDQ